MADEECKVVMYGLTLDGQPLGFITSSNGNAEYCVDTQFALDKTSENIWMATNIKSAMRARNNDIPWYAAGYDTPSNPYVRENTEIVRYTITVTKVFP